MRHLAIAAAFLALVPLVAFAGGKACQIAQSAVPTPGLFELVMGSKTEPVPEQVRLSVAQVDALADCDTKIREALGEVEARKAKLPAGEHGESRAALAEEPLAALVTRCLAEAACDRALVIDVETAREFRLATDAAARARERGDKSLSCELCLAVRSGMQAKFAWKAGEFAALTPAQEKEAAELASKRDELRHQWTAAVQAQLTAPQLAWLRDAQMRWLKETLRGSLVHGVRTLAAKNCRACEEQATLKCEFCSIVSNAVEQAKAKL
jgi:hypothetical protein